MTQVAAKNNFIKTMIADLNLTGTFFDFRGVGKGGGEMEFRVPVTRLECWTDVMNMEIC